ncbi:proteoglycan 4-like [Diaphorina citri]|uniref:Proteoglycan 4-like n=1 Tax=Diaphorina citri TaxID=121845 RepID=A0A3Q0INY9_DIACI|nr:proteoglycan 4-like [Diaphorina citri]
MDNTPIVSAATGLETSSTWAHKDLDQIQDFIPTGAGSSGPKWNLSAAPFTPVGTAQTPLVPTTPSFVPAAASYPQPLIPMPYQQLPMAAAPMGYLRPVQGPPASYFVPQVFSGPPQGQKHIMARPPGANFDPPVYPVDVAQAGPIKHETVNINLTDTRKGKPAVAQGYMHTYGGPHMGEPLPHLSQSVSYNQPTLPVQQPVPQVNNVLPIVMPPQSREPVVSAASLSETTQPKLPTQSAPQQPAQPPKEKRVIVQQPPQEPVVAAGAAAKPSAEPPVKPVAELKINSVMKVDEDEAEPEDLGTPDRPEPEAALPAPAEKAPSPPKAEKAPKPDSKKKGEAKANAVEKPVEAAPTPAGKEGAKGKGKVEKKPAPAQTQPEPVTPTAETGKEKSPAPAEKPAPVTPATKALAPANAPAPANTKPAPKSNPPASKPAPPAAFDFKSMKNLGEVVIHDADKFRSSMKQRKEAKTDEEENSDPNKRKYSRSQLMELKNKPESVKVPDGINKSMDIFSVGAGTAGKRIEHTLFVLLHLL